MQHLENLNFQSKNEGKCVVLGKIPQCISSQGKQFKNNITLHWKMWSIWRDTFFVTKPIQAERDNALILQSEICMTPNHAKIICSCHSYPGLQNTIFVPSLTLLWGARHGPYLFYLLLLPEVSSLGDEFPCVLPPAHARGLLALAEKCAHLQKAVSEKGGVGLRSLVLYRVERGSHKSPSAATVWSPQGQVVPCLVKKQDRVIKSPGLQGMIYQAERQNYYVGFFIFQQITSGLFYPWWDFLRLWKKAGWLEPCFKMNRTDRQLFFSLGRNHTRVWTSKWQHKTCWLILLSFAIFPPKTSESPGNRSTLKTKPTTCGKFLGTE